ncbi:hypothetical protein Enr8_25500 [Blastopirellula retiformator]|uniref:Uncharacterized protein n=1 Tax=Blastopirellula retiformator TaxID=2527970 RepID=A0A5C5V2B1_9BACT|nr:hypothetical protein Enr8_25500 [Blastopirellula retiformator]
MKLLYDIEIENDEKPIHVLLPYAIYVLPNQRLADVRAMPVWCDDCGSVQIRTLDESDPATLFDPPTNRSIQLNCCFASINIDNRTGSISIRPNETCLPRRRGPIPTVMATSMTLRPTA